MADEQMQATGIFDAYWRLLRAQFSFTQWLIQANVRMAGLWRGTPAAIVDDERPSVAARKT